MTTLQIILIALFIYLGSIGSIIGNTLGWYTLGRPLVASFVVGLILGDVQTAMVVGIPLQIMYMGNVTPGGAVAWDLSYATYRLSKKVGGEAQNLGGDFGGESVLSLGETLGERP